MKPRPLTAAAILSILMVVIGAPGALSVCDNGSTAGWFMLTLGDPNIPPGQCYMAFHLGVDTVTVSIGAVPFQKARFSVPDPPYGTVLGETWFFPHTGDRLSGVEMDLGACTTTGIVTLGEVYVMVLSEPTDCYSLWQVNAGCEIQSCSGTWLPAGGMVHNVGPVGQNCCMYWQFCHSLPPYDLYPPDGATDVPVNVALTWVAPEGFDPNCGVFIGTDPTCATVQNITVPCGTGTLAPDFLLPNTTYYWRPYWVGDQAWGCAGTAAFHSFTTGAPLATQKSTWGYVKAIYRQ